jgi:hypothetical protein
MDDFLAHQTPETIDHVYCGDRGFYDRYYFNCHSCSDDIFLITGMGQYPNLGVTDAFVAISHDERHSVVRASRELGSDRLDTKVGPLGVEVLEGLKRLRVWCDPNEWGLDFDLTFDGFVPALEEPVTLRRTPRASPRWGTTRATFALGIGAGRSHPTPGRGPGITPGVSGRTRERPSPRGSR